MYRVLSRCQTEFPRDGFVCSVVVLFAIISTLLHYLAVSVWVMPDRLFTRQYWILFCAETCIWRSVWQPVWRDANNYADKQLQQSVTQLQINLASKYWWWNDELLAHDDVVDNRYNFVLCRGRLLVGLQFWSWLVHRLMDVTSNTECFCLGFGSSWQVRTEEQPPWLEDCLSTTIRERSSSPVSIEMILGMF